MNPDCPGCRGSGATVIRHGSYYRADDSRKIQRYLCRKCTRSFSRATLSDAYRQQKRRINHPIKQLLASGMSIRRIAIVHGISKCTVAARIPFLAKQARAEHRRWLELHSPFDAVQFDDLETFEHTKCKPLTVPAVVDEKSHRVLGYAVAPIPAKGPLAIISRKKYGPRADGGRTARQALFESLIPHIHPSAHFRSDQHQQYQQLVKRYFPSAIHKQYPSRRGAVTGQGELKKIGFDPLFAINHSFAMFRANVNRLIRKTWCTTKRMDRLEDHLAIFVSVFNQGVMNSYWRGPKHLGTGKTR
ncbi:MAG: transposase [Gammaproteobacteria bacterium]|nr:transposase [Gammaproteobacteria bacterium]